MDLTPTMRTRFQVIKPALTLPRWAHQPPAQVVPDPLADNNGIPCHILYFHLREIILHLIFSIKSLCALVNLRYTFQTEFAAARNSLKWQCWIGNFNL
jgi:hypothetical protein